MSRFSFSRKIISLAALSVIMVETIQVTSIISTTPFSISLFTSITPGATSMRMPTMVMAMAPAAWADVRPNIMWPSALGRRKMMAEA